MSVYILLLHGRDDPAQDMTDWGYTGPVLGPFKAVHFAYKENIDCSGQRGEVLSLRYHEDMLVHEGKYYGDFEITSNEPVVHRQEKGIAS